MIMITKIEFNIQHLYKIVNSILKKIMDKILNDMEMNTLYFCNII